MKRYTYFISFTIYDNNKKHIGEGNNIIITNAKIICNEHLENVKKIILDNLLKQSNNSNIVGDICIIYINILNEEELGSYVQ